jgi:hypothetical protein
MSAVDNPSSEHSLSGESSSKDSLVDRSASSDILPSGPEQKHTNNHAEDHAESHKVMNEETGETDNKENNQANNQANSQENNKEKEPSYIMSDHQLEMAELTSFLSLSGRPEFCLYIKQALQNILQTHEDIMQFWLDHAETHSLHIHETDYKGYFAVVDQDIGQDENQNMRHYIYIHHDYVQKNTAAKIIEDMIEGMIRGGIS